MQEELISFETAKLAKKAGFNIPVKYGVFGQKMKLTVDMGHSKYPEQRDNDWNKKPRKSFSIPTQALLQKWLREEHGIYIEILTDRTMEPKFCFRFFKYIKDFEWKVDFSFTGGGGFCSWLYKTYEEALEAGLQQVLELLTNKK